MLDANAFDYVLDHAIDPRSVRRLGDIHITTVQHGELLSVPDPRRRRRLLQVLSAIDPTVRPAFTESWAGAGAPDGGTAPFGEPSTAAGGRRGSSHRRTNPKDTAIGEVARLEGCVLVTDDKAFRHRAIASGLTAMSCADAFADLPAAPDR